jgi:hypothetical protein
VPGLPPGILGHDRNGRAFRKMSLQDILAGLWFSVNSVKGKSALRLSHELGVQYKTAWVLLIKRNLCGCWQGNWIIRLPRLTIDDKHRMIRGEALDNIVSHDVAQFIRVPSDREPEWPVAARGRGHRLPQHASSLSYPARHSVNRPEKGSPMLQLAPA